MVVVTIKEMHTRLEADLYAVKCAILHHGDNKNVR